LGSTRPILNYIIHHEISLNKILQCPPRSHSPLNTNSGAWHERIVEDNGAQNE